MDQSFSIILVGGETVPSTRYSKSSSGPKEQGDSAL